jgi:hypothetical protein
MTVRVCGFRVIDGEQWVVVRNTSEPEASPMGFARPSWFAVERAS